MENKDIKKYIKSLSHQVDYIEKDLDNTYKHIESVSKHVELSTRSLKAIKSIINQLSQDIYLDEVEGKTISYNNFKDNNVDVVYTTRNGTKKEFSVPVHPYGQVEEKELFDRLEAIAKADVPLKSTSNTPLPSMEEKAAAFQQCCGKCTN